MKSLVIVESPTKARTIGKFLGDSFEVKASMGHIYDLPKSKLGVDVEKNFEPQYELMPDKKKILADLKKSSKDTEKIIMATDLDREGEAIAYHISQAISKNREVQRIVFHEITKEAIEDALKNPKKINLSLVDAQTARRVLDRLVGYKLSPVLWKKVRRGLSAGRVQSVALRLIVEREREIEKFKKAAYFTIHANLKQKDGASALFDLEEINGVRVEASETFNLYDGEYKVTKTSVDKEETAKEIVSDLSGKEYKVKEVLQKETKRSPGPPYTTSTLQQDASRRFGYSGRRTMSLAQKLYEEGFITYHRTDSVSISNSAISLIRKFVEGSFGQRYLPPSPRVYKTKQKLAQEAHEAIRPTNVGKTSEDIKNELGSEYIKLYDLIWRRAVATQMADAITESTTVLAETKGKNEYTLKTTGSVLIFEGFLKVNPTALSDRKLPQYKKDEILSSESVSHESHETPPPPRYNDASLIKTLEEKGIGRPSTYATIISVIETRAYIERVEARFQPTSVGIAVNDFLVSNFSTVDDIPFTADMEDQLDMIAKGEKEWVPVIKEFYSPFEKKLEEVEKAARVKIPVEETDQLCPECKKGNLVIRTGRFGKFFSCSRFPDCKFTKPFVEETNLLCPKDGGKVIIKKTRKGRKFYGCANYPKCDFAAWKLEDIKKTSQQEPKQQEQQPAQ